MKKALAVFVLLCSVLLSFPQTTNFSFTNRPFTDPELPNYHRGAQYWNGTPWDNSQAPQVPPGTPTTGAKTLYSRYWWSDHEVGQGGYRFTKASMGNLFWRSPEWHLEWCANNGALYAMGGMMTAWDAQGEIYYDGAWSVYPQYLHNLMQTEPVYKDWKYTGTNNWVPNWNSQYYLDRWRVLNDTLLKYIKNWKYTPTSGPWAGKLVEGWKIIDFIDLRGYGNYGEWHTWPWGANDGGNEPTWGKATDSSLKKIIDIGADVWGDYPLHLPAGVFDDNPWGEGTAFSAYWAMTRKTRYGVIGWRRDNIGGEGLDGILKGNTFTQPGWRADTAILDRWKYAMITGEPLNGGGTCCPYYWHIRPEINDYHYAGFGNGNYGSTTQQVWDTIQAVFKLTGYRYNLNGGSMTSTLTAGQSFTTTLNWRNVGASPLYQKRWKVKYELKDSADRAVQSWDSRFNLYLFLPSTVDSVILETFTLNSSIVSGNKYKLTVKIEDAIGLLSPLFIAINSPTRNSDGSYTLRSNITVQQGGANIPPTANAGPDQTITLPTTGVTLTGSGSDANGKITAYSWSQVSGPATAIIDSPSSASTTIKGLAIAGVYTFRLTVTDDSSATASDQVDITVNGVVNKKPTANAGVDQTITLPTSATTLTGSGSDSDGVIISYAWTQISGPVTATISTASTATTNVTGLTTAGTYVFQLTVTDDSSATASDRVSIIVNAVPNIPPVADAGSNQLIVQPVSSVTLSGSGSDEDGTIIGYKWIQISGPSSATIQNSTSATTDVSGLTAAGTYVFQLTVTDNNNATASDVVDVVVDQGVLPITWYSFSAKKKGSYVNLVWTTSCSEANVGYEVQKSLDGTLYSVIGNVMPESNCQTFTYSFRDYNLNNNVLYYRIKQVSQDGTTSFSTVTRVQIKGKKTNSSLSNSNSGISPYSNHMTSESDAVISSASMIMYPNPTNSRFNVVINAEEVGQITLRVFSMDGKIVKQSSAAKAIYFYSTVLDIQDLNTGVYYVKAFVNNKLIGIQKLVKQ